MNYLEEVDYTRPGFGELYDELPLWSAPFGLLLLDRVPMKPGLTILDVGAGTGFLTLELAQRCGPDSKVIAVDPWQAGMSRLRWKLDRLGLVNVLLIEEDAAKMDLPESSIDVVVSNLGINNFEDPGAVLRACFRVAKPGAKLLLTTNLVGHMSELYDLYRATLVELGQTDRLAVLDAHVDHRGTVDSVSGLLTDAGFEMLNVDRQSFRMRFADGSSLLRHSFIRLGFVPGWKSVAAADSVERTFETLERNLNAAATERGELALTVPMACIEAGKPTSATRNGRHRRQCSADLQAQDRHSLSRRLRQPLDREEQYDRCLSGHEELPDVGRRALIRLRGGPVQGDEHQHSGEGTERHGHGKERARSLQHGGWTPFAGRGTAFGS